MAIERNRLSYEEVALLVERVSGERLLSDQKIGQIVSNKALKLSQQIHRDMIATLKKVDQQVVKVSQKIDIYNSELKEILLFDDGIQVKSQKARATAKNKTRKSRGKSKVCINKECSYHYRHCTIAKSYSWV